MAAIGQVEAGKMCRAAPLGLGLMQALSCIAQILMEIDGANVKITPLFIVWFTITLSPILVLFLVRRACFLIGVMGVPIAAVFCGRIHYGLIFLDTKRLPQMGDWAMWLNSLFGLVSAGIFAAWMLSLASIGLAGWFGRAISNFRKD
jgi:hypothetical protein